MRSWGASIGLLGPKFWAIYRKEGLTRALLRGKIYKPTHEKGGYEEELARLVGTDEFGNRYYEDFNHHNKNTRRWVEYADYNKWFMTPKKVAPAWHGWLHYQYDDPPKKDNFVEPYFRPHRTVVFKTDHPSLAYKNPGHLLNENRQENLDRARARKYTPWEPPTGSEKKDGKKIIVEK